MLGSLAAAWLVTNLPLLAASGEARWAGLAISTLGIAAYAYACEARPGLVPWLRLAGVTGFLALLFCAADDRQLALDEVLFSWGTVAAALTVAAAVLWAIRPRVTHREEELPAEPAFPPETGPGLAPAPVRPTQRGPVLYAGAVAEPEEE